MATPLLTLPMVAHKVRGIDPLKRLGQPSLRTGLAAYSLRKYLDLKAPKMDLFGFASKAAEWGFEGVEPTSYYFKEITPAFLAHFKAHCSQLGLEITGSAVGNDFCLKEEKALEEQIASTVQWAKNTAIMGGRTLRIFAGRTPKGTPKRQQLQGRSKESRPPASAPSLMGSFWRWKIMGELPPRPINSSIWSRRWIMVCLPST